MKRTFLLLLSMILFTACHTEEKVAESTAPQEQGGGAAIITVVSNDSPAAVASPRVIIYKMKKDYSRNVPVTLSEDRKTIVSYPHPRDIYTNGKLALPTQLKEGYWLDNRGINENVAFLSYTYEEYSQLTDAPDLNTLYKKIIDKDPIKEMWVCGHRHNYKDVVFELNNAISFKELDQKFKRLK